MARDGSDLYVYAWLNGGLVPAGRLRVTPGLCEFRYGRSFQTAGYSLDPINLPLSDRVYTSDRLQGVLGAFGDALPDHWGRHVLKKQANRPLGVTELLLADNSVQRMGALAFSQNLEPMKDEAGHGVEWMQSVIEWMEDPSSAMPVQIERGSSAGGAKPKGTVRYLDREWLAKVAPSDDRKRLPLIEHATYRLATHCGIPVPETKTLELPNGEHLFLIERFDRCGDERLHYLSAHTICSVLTNHQGAVINDNRSYLRFADQLAVRSANPDADRVDLFRRVAFNVLVNNHDDHAKNHGMVRTQDGAWCLSPAFDLVAGEGDRRDLAMIAGPYGTQASLENLLLAHEHFALGADEAEYKLETLIDTLADWREILAVDGLDEGVIEEMAWAIQDQANVPRIEADSGSPGRLPQNCP